MGNQIRNRNAANQAYLESRHILGITCNQIYQAAEGTVREKFRDATALNSLPFQITTCHVPMWLGRIGNYGKII